MLKITLKQPILTDLLVNFNKQFGAKMNYHAKTKRPGTTNPGCSALWEPTVSAGVAVMPFSRCISRQYSGDVNALNCAALP